jgi:[1-hydroxy-2-(trimethylamino)ethyl]phosphonate dioxygenase
MVLTDFANIDRSNIIAFIGDIFTRRGADSYVGEDVTMSQHMLQGAQLAEQAEAGDAMIAAALLHDIGHYTNEFPKDALETGTDNHHDEAGAAVLAAFFPKSITDCVRYHVAAKRFLCATDAHYFDRLSAASVHTLGLQGGPMDDAEVSVFSKKTNLEAILQVRIWDDAGKVKDMETPDFDHYAPMLQRVVDAYLD